MRLAALAQTLRDTSDRFGGITHYLAIAGDIDRACSRFLEEQDTESLANLLGVVSRAERFRKEVTVVKGPKAG